MSTLRVAGTIDESLPEDEMSGPRAGGLFEVTTKAVVRLDAARAVGSPPSEIGDVTDDDLLELELEGGIKLWTSVEKFREDFPEAVRRDGRSTVLEVPSDLPLGSPSRGMGTWALKGLKVMKVDLPGTVAGTLASKLERRLIPRSGLHRLPDSDPFTLEPLDADGASFAGESPCLLFIHGTGSSTRGSFGELWEPAAAAVRRELYRKYGDRVFALEHYTLTESPIDNALQIMRAVPAGARLHLVTHSRGGLVGELLCRGSVEGNRDPYDRDELGLLSSEGDARTGQVAALEELNRLLKEKRPRVERFVRAACPARGTTLASGRMDRWLSIMVNLVGMIPVLKASGVYQFFSDLLLAVARERTDPTTLPGLEAMIPESPLIRILNRPGVRVAADLSVIAGDIEATSFFGRLKLLIPDLFYRGDHDLVVDTRAMYGGAARVSGARFFFDQGPDVSHFNYFRNDRTARKLLSGLTRAEGSNDGFEPLIPGTREIRQLVHRARGVAQPTVFVLPGIMGSHLTLQGNRIWLDVVDIALGRMTRLGIDADNVAAQAPIGRAYGDLIDYLAGSHEVIAFPYDWRISLLDEARRFARLLALKLHDAERAGQPVRILAHSMGGLLARVMIAEFPEIWDRVIRHPGGRLIMLGTPNGGSYVIPRLLVGQEDMVRKLALLDFAHSQRELLEVIARYPGVLEMLPADDSHPFFEESFWKDLARDEGGKSEWHVPPRTSLERARAVRRLIDASPIHPERMIYVAGRNRATPESMKLDPAAAAGERIQFMATALGDGRVPWKSGVPEGIKPYYMEASHGGMADHKPDFPAILELLQTGRTSRLSTTAPVLVRGTEETFPLPPDPIDLFPGEEEMERSVLGMEPWERESVVAPRVKVSIVHGDLAFARHPVAVGHYLGDTIVSAEDYLDRRLEGRLRHRHKLGRYPGALNTSAIVLTPTTAVTTLEGAVIVGLGRVGELTPRALTASVANAALEYALALEENRSLRGETAAGLPVAAGISSVLIGTGAGGLSVQDSVIAILHGVAMANRQLELSGQDLHVRIEAVEFLELYGDLALQAARTFSRVPGDPVLRDRFDCAPIVRRGEGMQWRATFDESPGWWQRLQIAHRKDGSLRFNSMTNRARAEINLLPTQRALVDRFIQQSIHQTGNNREVARTLFELLLPNGLKEHAPDRGDMVLVLDDESAAYPWELLEDRFGGGERPGAVQAGLVRQLETEEFRRNAVSDCADTALVVGDPLSPFIPLPGAENEARQVAQLLAARSFGTTERIRSDAGAIVQALHANAYRILHLAGHGVHEYRLKPGEKTCSECHQPIDDESRRISGMVIGEDVFLTPADVNQMRHVPDLVFINCCHLGQTVRQDERDSARDDRHKLAANIASQFIRMGVRAVIAAGWAVDDAAAKTFATRFYDEMLGGTPFGRAVLAARQATFERHPAVNTWGAYQAYGDPDFSFRSPAPGASGASHGPEFFSPHELVVALENLTSRAKTGDIGERLKQIEKIVADRHREWLTLADVCAAFGAAFGETGRFADAIRSYEAALRAKRADLPVVAVEQLANIRCRHAVELVRAAAPRDAKSAREEAATLIDSAVRLLESLTQFSPTAERFDMMASAWKRKARVVAGRDRVRALEKMREFYGKSRDTVGEHGAVDHYPMLNLAMAEILLLSRSARPPAGRLKEISDRIDRAQKAAAANHLESPDFWNTVAAIDCDVVRHLIRADLDGNVDAVAVAYRKIRDRFGSPREFASVIDQLEFLAEMLQTRGKSKTKRAKQADALVNLIDALRE